MDIEEKKQKAREILAVIGEAGFRILLAISELNRKEHLHDGFLPSLQSKMKKWQQKPFEMESLTHWCPLLFHMKMIGIAESSQGDQRYLLSFDAQRLVLWVTQWAKAENGTNEWAGYLPEQFRERLLQHGGENSSRARAA